MILFCFFLCSFSWLVSWLADYSSWFLGGWLGGWVTWVGWSVDYCKLLDVSAVGRGLLLFAILECLAG